MDYREFQERYRYNAEKDLIGVGGFGKVYRARDTKWDRMVALKVFSRDVPTEYSLIGEIKRAIDLNHPNICRYIDAEVFSGTDAFGEAQEIQVGIMELIGGGTIDVFLRKHPQHRKKLLADVLRGLSYLHRHQPPIIHRDLKPSNVLVDIADGVPTAKITDFGISKASRESGVWVSRLGVGTCAYMAPEQVSPERYGIDGKIQCNLDLWSFGAMTMELLTGVMPFGAHDVNASDMQILALVVRGVPEQVLNGFEEPYRSVLARCMVQEAGKRVRTAAELLRVLEALPQAEQRLAREFDFAASQQVTVLEVREKTPDSTHGLAPLNTTRTSQGHPNSQWIWSIAFSPDGRTLASGDCDSNIHLWDLTNRSILHRMQSQVRGVSSLAFSPDSRTLVSTGCKNNIEVWSAANGKLLRTLSGHTDSVHCAKFSPDGRLLASGSMDNTIRLWDTASGSLLRTLQGPTDTVLSVAFSPDGQTLASGGFSDNTVKLWDVASGNVLRILKGTTAILSVDISPDGRMVAAGDYSTTVKLWNFATGELIRTMQGVSGIDGMGDVAFSPDSRFIASRENKGKAIKLWDVATGETVRSSAAENASCFAFSADRCTLAWGDSSKAVQIWDAFAGPAAKSWKAAGNAGTETVFEQRSGSVSPTSLKQSFGAGELGSARVAAAQKQGFPFDRLLRRWGYTLLLSISLAFTLAGLWWGISSSDPDHWTGYKCAGFFGLCSAWYAFKVFVDD